MFSVPLLTTWERSVQFNMMESISDISIQSYPTDVGLSNSFGKSDWSFAS